MADEIIRKGDSIHDHNRRGMPKHMADHLKRESAKMYSSSDPRHPVNQELAAKKARAAAKLTKKPKKDTAMYGKFERELDAHKSDRRFW